MKYLLVLTILLTGCNEFVSPKYKKGQKVTNGYCTGYVNSVSLKGFSDFEYQLVVVKCMDYTQNFMYMNQSEIIGEGI